MMRSASVVMCPVGPSGAASAAHPFSKKICPFATPIYRSDIISTHKTHNRLDSGVFAYEFVSFIITLLKKECIIVAP